MNSKFDGTLKRFDVESCTGSSVVLKGLKDLFIGSHKKVFTAVGRTFLQSLQELNQV